MDMPYTFGPRDTELSVNTYIQNFYKTGGVGKNKLNTMVKHLKDEEEYQDLIDNGVNAYLLDGMDSREKKLFNKLPIEVKRNMKYLKVWKFPDGRMDYLLKFKSLPFDTKSKNNLVIIDVNDADDSIICSIIDDYVNTHLIPDVDYSVYDRYFF